MNKIVKTLRVLERGGDFKGNIAKKAHISQPNTNRVLDYMEQQGLVDYRHMIRGMWVNITPTGRQALELYKKFTEFIGVTNNNIHIVE